MPWPVGRTPPLLCLHTTRPNSNHEDGIHLHPSLRLGLESLKPDKRQLHLTAFIFFHHACHLICYFSQYMWQQKLVAIQALIIESKIKWNKRIQVWNLYLAVIKRIDGIFHNCLCIFIPSLFRFDSPFSFVSLEAAKYGHLQAYDALNVSSLQLSH